MSVRYCPCDKPQPTTTGEGIVICETCEERIEPKGQRDLAAYLRGIERHTVLTHQRVAEQDRSTFALNVPPELIEQLAQRAAEIALEQLNAEAGDRWLRGAKQIGEYIGASKHRVYALRNCEPSRIPPVIEDGSTLVAKRSELDRWMREGGGKRP